MNEYKRSINDKPPDDYGTCGICPLCNKASYESHHLCCKQMNYEHIKSHDDIVNKVIRCINKDK